MEFKDTHKRPPRVLHIGNIANNAYLNAKFLNEAGFDCDVMCYDYYHIMACPEWEDAEYQGQIEDQSNPDWTKVDLGAFRRPSWFAQGPLATCMDYLIARREGNADKANIYWHALSVANKTKAEESVEVKSYLAVTPNNRIEKLDEGKFTRVFELLRALAIDK